MELCGSDLDKLTGQWHAYNVCYVSAECETAKWSLLEAHRPDASLPATALGGQEKATQLISQIMVSVRLA